jgi:putative addiction module component (TIGR02574 family)
MKRYAVVVENAGTNFAAYVPDLPGCVATGNTKEEVERLIREAIEMHLEGMAEDGLPMPEPVELLELTGDNAAGEVGLSPLTDTHKQDPGRRLAAYEANPKAGSIWEEVKARLRKRDVADG